MSQVNQAARVLVVDDESVTRMMVRRTLSDSGYEVLEADDGAAAVELCRRMVPDLVLMDVRMPGLNGFDACRALRALPAVAHVPVLMLTALDDTVATTMAFEAGATDFVTKPINWALLAQRLRYALRTHATEHELRESQMNLAQAQKIARLGQWRIHLADERCECSAEMRAMLGLAAGDQASLESLMARLADEDRPRLRCFIEALRDGGMEAEIEVRVTGDAPQWRHLLMSGQVWRDDAGQPRTLFGIVQDLTERREAEARLSYQAHFDAVTGLPNRVLFRDRLEAALATAARDGQGFVVLEVETDALRKAHAAGRMADSSPVLRALTQRLQSALGEGDTLCRLDGEQFGMLLTSIDGSAVEAAGIARRLIDAFTEPLSVQGWELPSSIHVGIALHPADGGAVDALLERAGAAVARARSQGGSASQFYADGIQSCVSRVIDTQVALYHGLERDEFELHYQPLVDLRDGCARRVEALLRWRRPQHGLQMPDSFIPILEESGMIIEAGDWVLRRAGEQIGPLPVTVAVNLSPQQFLQPGLGERVLRLLGETGLPPERLELEITEQAVMADEARAVATLRELAGRGIGIALDDYGVGFSSLQRLKTLPLDTLKIDRFFVTSLLTDRADAAIVRSTIELCHDLGIRVVAEGTEDDATLARLREYDCDIAQGYGISRPLPIDRLRDWLQHSPYAPQP